MEFYKFGILFIIGIGVFSGILGASLFQRIRIPQVVGYIIIGLILGQSGLHLIVQKDVEALSSFNMFALGIIGFLVGGELKAESFKKYGKQFFSIMLGEGLAAFFAVAIITGGLVYYFIPNVMAALAAGIVFGAIASATDPASTVDVLWEYRSKGILTTTLIAIVALDDALAMSLYGIGSGTAELLLGGTNTLTHELYLITIELFGAVAVGVGTGVALNYILKSKLLYEKKLPIAIGTILLIISSSLLFNMDIILATMTFGCVLTNLAPRRSKEIFSLVRSFSSPIYVMFFVLVGASLNVFNMPAWLWLIVTAYVLFRTIGKMGGAYYGAKIAGASEAVKKYVGMGLFAQGGIAIGLSIIASQRLNSINVNETMTLGNMVVFVITATTLVVQLIGPSLVKLSISLAGEKGKNITDEDVIQTLTVKDVVSKAMKPIPESEPVSKVVQNFSNYDYLSYPVVDKANKLVGVISLESLKNLLTERECWTWLIARDVMLPATDTVTGSMKLEDAINYMKEINTDQIPIVSEQDNPVPIGILERQSITKTVSEELIKRTSGTC